MTPTHPSQIKASANYTARKKAAKEERYYKWIKPEWRPEFDALYERKRAEEEKEKEGGL